MAGDELVVARDHLHRDAGLLTLGHRGRHLRPHRILEADEPLDDEVLLVFLARGARGPS